MRIISQRTYTPGTWAGGSTRAIWADPPDSLGSPASARCWAGTATIERAAPYSFFAGRLRLHLPIRGRGLRLHFRDPAQTILLACGEPYRFDGEHPVEAALVDGPVVAFNLIYRADSFADAVVAVVGPEGLRWPAGALMEPGATSSHVPLRMVYSIAGSLAIRAGDDQPATLESDDTLVVPARERADAAPLLLTSVGATPAEVVLATLWLPDGTAS
jgi:environmental stress-induced protein Ves